MQKFEFVPEGIEECLITAWIHARSDIDTKQIKYPAIIICPGGGYFNVSPREAEPVAKHYFAAGYNTFILKYSTGDKAKDFYPLCQLAYTMVYIRKHADQLNTFRDRIAVCGFSAGGHLAASLGTLYNTPEFIRRFECSEHIRPDAIILSYPVITSDEYAHVGSIRRVSGADVGTDTYTWFGLDRHVNSNTPPMFLWHTAADNTVPVENSLKMCMALSKARVPFECHVFPEGRHGMSVCTEEVNTPCAYNARWVEWSIEWLKRHMG